MARQRWTRKKAKAFGRDNERRIGERLEKDGVKKCTRGLMLLVQRVCVEQWPHVSCPANYSFECFMGKWNCMMALHNLSLLQFLSTTDQLKVFALIQLFERHLHMVITQA